MRIICALPFVVKLALATLVLGFTVGFYVGLGAAPTSTGTPVPLIDESMPPQQPPVRVQKLGLGPELLPATQEKLRSVTATSV